MSDHKQSFIIFLPFWTLFRTRCCKHRKEGPGVGHGSITGMRPANARAPAREAPLGCRPAPSVASPTICRSALAIEAHRGVASLANTLGIGCAMCLGLRSDG